MKVPDPLLRRILVEDFLVESADAVVRRCLLGDDLAHSVHDRFETEPTALIRFLRSLVAAESSIQLPGADREALYARVREWVGKVVGKRDEAAWRTCFHLRQPDTQRDSWQLVVCLQAVRDSSVVVPAEV